MFELPGQQQPAIYYIRLFKEKRQYYDDQGNPFSTPEQCQDWLDSHHLAGDIFLVGKPEIPSNLSLPRSRQRSL